MRTTGRQVAILTVGVTLLSTFMKNIGALAIVIALVVLWRLVNLGFARFAIQPVASEGLGQRDRFMKYPIAGLLGRPRAPPRLLVRLGRSWPKLVLVAVLLGFAAWHRFRLTPALAARAPGAGARLADSYRRA